ncbi:HAD family hydrolase [Phytohabitans sp. LJ34]|uniref:HAD family hydrolase n=1 Tax=Phytohabitans sp. LJ34 TaxID=3452217 RepID=UPI003F8C1A96
MRLRAVLFDIGCVIIHPQERHFRQATLRGRGYPLPPGVALKALAETVWTGAKEPHPSAFWAGDDKARSWARHAGLPPDDGPAIWRVLERMDTDDDPLWSVLDEHAVPTLTAIRRAGLLVGAVSNGDGQLHRDLARHGIASFFDTVLDSRLEGVAKPDRKIFARAAARLGVPLESCVFVGDDPHSDVAASLAAGVRSAILFDRYALRPVSWHGPTAASLTEVASHIEAHIGHPGRDRDSNGA